MSAGRADVVPGSGRVSIARRSADNNKQEARRIDMASASSSISTTTGRSFLRRSPLSSGTGGFSPALGPAPRSRPYPPTPNSSHPPPSHTQSTDYWQHTRKHHAHQRNTEARISLSCRPHPQWAHHTTPVAMPASRFG